MNSIFAHNRFLNYIKFCLLLLFAAALALISYEFLNPLKKFIVSLGVIVIVISAITALFDFIQNYKSTGHKIDLIRYKLGAGILFGLELMVGADIIETIIYPTYYDIGLLGLLIIIRTFLSYFLNKEIAELSSYRPETDTKL